MTLLDAMENRFKEETNKLKEECKRGIEFIREGNQMCQYWPGEKFHILCQGRFDYKINRIELMSVDKNSNGQYYQQFLVEFEDITKEYVYVIIGEPNGKK